MTAPTVLAAPRVMELRRIGRFVLPLAILAAAGVAACGGARATHRGPAPEYEAPRVLPWDAGAGKRSGTAKVDEMNFDSVAQGEWVDETGDAPGEPQPGGTDAGPDAADGGVPLAQDAGQSSMERAADAAVADAQTGLPLDGGRR